jgi:hypothetical protein
MSDQDDAILVDDYRLIESELRDAVGDAVDLLLTVIPSV